MDSARRSPTLHQADARLEPGIPRSAPRAALTAGSSVRVRDYNRARGARSRCADQRLAVPQFDRPRGARTLRVRALRHATTGYVRSPSVLPDRCQLPPQCPFSPIDPIFGETASADVPIVGDMDISQSLYAKAEEALIFTRLTVRYGVPRPSRARPRAEGLRRPVARAACSQQAGLCPRGTRRRDRGTRGRAAPRARLRSTRR